MLSLKHGNEVSDKNVACEPICADNTEHKKQEKQWLNDKKE